MKPGPAIAVGLLATLFACGFGEDPDPPFSSTLDKTTTLADLASGDIDTFCSEYQSYLTGAAGLEDLCTFAGVLLVKTQGGDSDDCGQRRQQCLESPWEPPCRLTGQVAAGCPATVADLDRCVAAEAIELLELIRSVNCVDLTVSLDFPRPEACSEISQSCPGFYD